MRSEANFYLGEYALTVGSALRLDPRILAALSSVLSGSGGRRAL